MCTLNFGYVLIFFQNFITGYEVLNASAVHCNVFINVLVFHDDVVIIVIVLPCCRKPVPGIGTVHLRCFG